MSTQEPDGPPNKRRKLADNTPTIPDVITTSNAESPTEVSISKSLDRPISPPPSRRIRSRAPEPSTQRASEQHERVTPQSVLSKQIEVRNERIHQRRSKAPEPSTTRGFEQQKRVIPQLRPSGHENQNANQHGPQCTFLPSPIQLTRIQDLSPAQNLDTVGLGDILGDPMIKECWNFNFLFDIDFVMQHFDRDVRDLVTVKIIHGFWRSDDDRKTDLLEAASRYPNVELKSAYMPDPFGTHHSKMLILFRHDDQAQVIIHTANMITRDWRNMTQAVWRSPLLPLLQSPTAIDSLENESGPQPHPIGSGERFKTDLLCYINAYGKRLTDLTKQLVRYDFSSVRAAFIGSAPSRQKPAAAKPAIQTSFGWLGLREILSCVPIQQVDNTTEDTQTGAPNIVMQISSIATLGQTPAWLTHFQSVLSSHSTGTPLSSSSTAVATTNPTFQSARSAFFTKREPPKTTPKTITQDPTFNIIFPTASEIRNSLDGYISGFSIHTKLQSPAQQKQLQYLHPILCHWQHQNQNQTTPPPSSSSSSSKATSQPAPRRHRRDSRKSERGPAAPHIKTYIRFQNEKREKIDWAMVTSANLSKQAWGELVNKKEEVWIQSWETGVVVWPALFSSPSSSSSSSSAAFSASPGDDVDMVPVFGRDLPAEEDVGVQEIIGQGQKKIVVGFRMPYDLPLEPYGEGEVPWCASASHEEPDWKGVVWEGYQPH